jgi:tRNA(fMet)-specific endonuclease VapC
MSYLVDSDRVADWLRGRTDAVQLLSRLARDGLAISIITYGEIYDGIYHGPTAVRHEQGFHHFLRVARVLPLSRRIMRRFAHIRGDLRQRGQEIGDPDILIAATALQHDLAVVTRNRRHFERIPGLALHPET